MSRAYCVLCRAQHTIRTPYLINVHLLANELCEFQNARYNDKKKIVCP